MTSGELTGVLYTGTTGALLVYPVVGAIVFIRRRHIEPRNAVPNGSPAVERS